MRDETSSNRVVVCTWLCDAWLPPAVSTRRVEFAGKMDSLLSSSGAAGDLTAVKTALNAQLSSFPMRAELLALPPEERPSLALGSCEDTVEARAKGDSCAMLMRIAYRWLTAAYQLVDDR